MNNINGIQIFAVGEWNGDKYTQQDLDEMVQAFGDNKDKIKPYLKLGHDEDQKLLQNDGLPAAGWIGSLYRIGEKLYADFVDIPQKIYDLIQNKAYRKVSSEIYWNISIGEKVYNRMLAGVALLGADMPAVTSLDDILALYGLKGFETLKSYANSKNNISLNKVITFKAENKEISMTELEKAQKEIEEKQKALDLALAETKTFKKALEEKDSVITEFKKDYATMKEEQEQIRKDAKEAMLEKSLLELMNEKLVIPSMKPYVKALLGDEKKEYTFGDKSLSKLEIVKEILKLFKTASKVNFTENSKDVQVEETETDNSGPLNEQIEKYMAEHKVTYAKAYVAVMKKTK